MKIVWTLAIICCTHQGMIHITRPARPALTRAYGSRTTFSMKITNPKLIASLEAARLKSHTGSCVDPQPDARQRHTCDVIPQEHRINRGYAPQSSYAHRHTPHLGIAGGLGQAVAHETECFLQYKIYQKADEILCGGGGQIQTSISHAAQQNTNDDSEED